MDAIIEEHDRKWSAKTEEREKERNSFLDSISRKFSKRREQLEKAQQGLDQQFKADQEVDEKQTQDKIQRLTEELNTRTQQRQTGMNNRHQLLKNSLNRLVQEQISEIEKWDKVAMETWAVENRRHDQELGRQVREMNSSQSGTGSQDSSQFSNTTPSQPQERSYNTITAEPAPINSSTTSANKTAQLNNPLDDAPFLQTSLVTISPGNSSTQPYEIDNYSSDDEPLMSRRQREVSAATDSLPEFSRTVQTSDIREHEGIEELPKGSRMYYILRCPMCPNKGFTGMDAIKFHYNNRHKKHGMTMSGAQIKETCSLLVQNVSASWVKEHNDVIHKYKVAKAGENSTVTAGDTTLHNSPNNEDSMRPARKERNNCSPHPSPGTEAGISQRARSHARECEGVMQTDIAIYPPVMPGFDGIYHNPHYVENVPLEKIDPTAKYWEASWKTWEDYLKACPTETGHLRHRQKIIKFFENFHQHPNQILSKRYITDTGLLISEFPTKLHRVLVDLEYAKQKGRISILPFDWLRRRLMKLIESYERRGLAWRFKYQFLKFSSTDPEFLKVCKGIHNDEPSIREDSELESNSCQVSLEPDRIDQYSLEKDIDSSTTNTRSDLQPRTVTEVEKSIKRERHDSDFQNASPRPSKLLKNSHIPTTNRGYVSPESSSKTSTAVEKPAVTSSHGSSMTPGINQPQRSDDVRKTSHRATHESSIPSPVTSLHAKLASALGLVCSRQDEDATHESSVSPPMRPLAKKVAAALRLPHSRQDERAISLPPNSVQTAMAPDSRAMSSPQRIASSPLMSSQQEKRASLTTKARHSATLDKGSDITSTKQSTTRAIGTPLLSSQQEESSMIFRRTHVNMLGQPIQIICYKLDSRAEVLEPFHEDDKRVIDGGNKLIVVIKDVMSLAYGGASTVILAKKHPQDQSCNAVRLACTFQDAEDADQFFCLLHCKDVYVKNIEDM